MLINKEGFAIQDLKMRNNVNEDHDTECALKAGELIELGFMGQEFECYGIAYMDSGKIKYYVCDKEPTMLAFQERCLQNGWLSTSVYYHTQRFDVPVGKNEFFKAIVRKETAKCLKAHYGNIYFSALNSCCEKMHISDIAWQRLEYLCTKLRNSLDDNIIQIVIGLAKDLCKMKKITVEHYQIVEKWGTREFENMGTTLTIPQKYIRTYYGFCSKKKGVLKYYINASLFSTEKMKREKISLGEIVTPILKKQYSSNEYGNLQICRDEFKNVLKKYFTDTFMIGLQGYWGIPSNIDTVLYHELLRKIKIYGKTKEIEDFLYYGALWNTWRDNEDER